MEIPSNDPLVQEKLKRVKNVARYAEEGGKRLQIGLERRGIPSEEAKSISQETMEASDISDVMESRIDEALEVGADGYSIMEAIHTGAKEGVERAIKSPTFKDIVQNTIISIKLNGIKYIIQDLLKNFL